MRGKFIVIDGMDHSGKGVQIDLLRKALGTSVYFSREPGGTPLAEEIRHILLRQEGPTSNPLADFFLFWAARGSHVEDVVEKHRKSGAHVILDRYDSSTFTFQVCGEERRNLEVVFWAIRESLPASYWPDAYVFFDLPATVAHERGKRAKAKERSRFDVKPLEYHERVRSGFIEFAKKIGRSRNPAQVITIDANRSIDDVHADTLAIVQKILAA